MTPRALAAILFLLILARDARSQSLWDQAHDWLWPHAATQASEPLPAADAISPAPQSAHVAQPVPKPKERPRVKKAHRRR